MAKRREKGYVVNPYAVLVGNETVAVTPLAIGRIDQHATTEMYDEAKHKGKLKCPECSALLHFRKAAEKAGDIRIGRDHFARYRTTPHDLHCEVGLNALEDPGQNRVIAPQKAPYVYLNSRKIPPRPPYKTAFNKAARASSLPESITLLPEWIKAIKYEPNTHDFPRIANPDFHDRLRLNPIGGVAEYLRILKTLPAEKLKDTWVINNGVAVRFDRAIIKERMGHFPRDNASLQSVRENEQLPVRYPLACDGKYDRFSRILDECIKEIRHPVLLHFTVEKTSKKMDRKGGVRLRVDLPWFNIQNPDRAEARKGSTALPEISVYRYVHIKDPTVFSTIKAGQEYFAIAHPYLFKDDGMNGAYNLHFDVHRACDITQMTQHELADAIKKTRESRTAYARRKTGVTPQPETTPA